MFSSNTSSAEGGYQISRSLRFNSADSAYLNRTPANASNRTTWTWSAWVKRGDLSTATRGLFGAGTASSTDTGIYWTSADKIDFFDRSGGSLTGYVSTNAVFRDPSAWYHIVVVFDSGNATAANRMLIYINNVSQSLTVNNTLPQNTQSAVNNTVAHALGSLTGGSNVGNGYMTEVNFIDGQALTPSSFGQTNAQTGVWEPVAYSGSYGTNGFYLNFSDNSNTTAATLGKDYSGNGNNWTPNNFSVSAGAGNDSLVDTPTPYGVDTGVGGTVRGNYATWNPLDKDANITFSNGNLDAVGYNAGGTATFGLTSGKWYWEVTINDPYSVSGSSYYGIFGVSSGKPNSYVSGYVGYPTGAGVYATDFSSDGGTWASGSRVTSSTTWANGDVIGLAFDAGAMTLDVYRNNSKIGSTLTVPSGAIYPTLYHSGTSGDTSSSTSNFGQRPFAYTAPSGFKALCTQNLPTPTIGATSTTQAGKYFNPVLYTGTGSAQNISVGFEPDLVWIKCRNVGYSHSLLDRLRGITNARLFSNLTDAENTGTTYINSTNSDGFQLAVGDNGSNGSTFTYVAWNWKANGSGSSNTAGSITSTVSANTTSGFSVATFTKDASVAQTIGHGLGVAPSMIIVKTRGSSGYTGWAVWHTSIGIGNYLELNTTAASQASTTIWNNTLPTSTVFSMGTAWTASSNSMVAYCFAEVPGFSAFGSYTGNGSTDGPFVFTGMRPAFLMLKNTTTAGNAWHMIDTVRGTYNVYGPSLDANFSGAEITYTICDLLSNGFKLRDTNQAWNKSGDVYIIMAFASNPFKYALAR